LRATSCTADGVAADYDGALHVAVTDRDGRQSVMHQYAHHALTSRGLLGPAWAREGIALLIASESWWRKPRWLKQVASTPVDLAAMERDLPETMLKDEAALFSARAAALVSCAAHDHPNGLAGFVEALAGTARRLVRPRVLV
jgi:hypothetical protein